MTAAVVQSFSHQRPEEELMKLRRLLVLFTVGLCAATGSAWAQTYPAKPVRVIIVFPPGGSNDIVGRIVFQQMSEQMGQQFIIDNRGGAAGSLGTAVVAQSPADGYTLMVQSTTHVANPHMYKSLPYDTFKDIVGITPIARQVGVLTVHPSLPVKSVKDFIALAKKRPGEINYGHAGWGSYVHLTAALLESMAGIKLTHVPFKGGGPAAVALVSGETQAQIATISSLLTHIKANRVRPLGVTSPERVPQLPDVPAIGETVSGYDFTAWIGVFAPAGVPTPIINQLNAELRKVVSNPQVAEKLNAQVLDPMHMTPEEFAQRLKMDYERYGKLIRATGAAVN
jgi:tripartite-type tricarboxylate transporter receptor subunit TctC